MKIIHVQHPYVFTDTNERFEFKEINGTPRVGSELDEELNVLGNFVDENCTSGLCSLPLPDNKRG